jgi:hypothetical protein
MSTVLFINFICIWIAIAALQIRVSLASKRLNMYLKTIQLMSDRLNTQSDILKIHSMRMDIQSTRVDSIQHPMQPPKDIISGFSSNYRFLSNFFPVTMVVDGVEYPSLENAYQAAKTTDLQEKLSFVSMTAGQAKRAGSKVTLRPDWCDVRIGIMEELVRKKFTENHDLADALMATGTLELVETNDWGDCFWGVCEGKGDNWLGKILMKVRSELK